MLLGDSCGLVLGGSFLSIHFSLAWYRLLCRSVQELSVQYEPHDLLTHLPPQLHMESELDKRYSSLMEDSKGEWGGGMSEWEWCV